MANNKSQRIPLRDDDLSITYRPDSSFDNYKVSAGSKNFIPLYKRIAQKRKEYLAAQKARISASTPKTS